MTDSVTARLPSLRLPANGWPLIALLAIFLWAGTLGHDPWKIEDAAHFGVVWRAHGADNWLSLGFAGARVVEPPLYYWLGGVIGGLLAPFLGWPDAVRLASPLFAATACTMLYLSARELYGREVAGAAPLALIGSLGFLVQSHETQPMMAVLAGVSATVAGIALGWKHKWTGGALIGAGLAGVLLAHGVTLLPALLLCIAVGIFTSPERRTAAIVAVSGIALGGILSSPWFWQLGAASPAALDAWWANELAQFDTVKSPADNALRFGELLLWFAWPALPLAVWSIWVNRQRLTEPAYLLPVAATLAMAANLAIVFPARGVIALALLPPLALLAVPGLSALRRGAANAFDWFGRMTFSLLAGVIWLGWVAMNFGVPARLARNFAKLAPGFAASPDALLTAVAVLMTLLWLWLIGVRDRAPSPLRPLAHWASGMTLLWVLTVCLWLPWIEYGRSYRSVATAIDGRIPTQTTCLSVRGVGEGQLASLDYFLSRRLQPEVAGKITCRWLVVQGTAAEQSPGAGWQKVWEGSRPGDRSERFRLYRRG